MPLGSLVDWESLGKTAAYALVGAVGITAAFSFGIVGAHHLGHARREARLGASLGWGLVLGLCGAVIIGGIVLALIVMAQKSS